MIDITTARATSRPVSVDPSDRIFEELGRNTYSYRDLLSELIDNCVAARAPGAVLNVTISIFVDPAGKARRFVIRDDATGIPEDKLGAALSPAALQTSGSLNEHGLGMKQAIGALGKLEYLATKVATEATGRAIKELKFGALTVYEVAFDGTSGTEIAVGDLKNVASGQATTYTRDIVPYLGARYRRLLKPENKVLHLRIELRKLDRPEIVDNAWLVEEVKPTYFHPSTRRNEPVILAHRLEGPGWAAELTFGYAPARKEEYEELGLAEPTKFHPYRTALSTQGVDIIFHDRVILFHQLSQLGLTPAPHNRYNSIRGEIDLKHGFSTAITKNAVINDEHFSALIASIRRILIGEEAGPGGRKKDYLEQPAYPEDLPEVLLQDRLAEWLGSNPMHPRTVVSREYVVQGIEGAIDILADGEAWEMKTGISSAYDVYQLFMYLDVGNISKGFLVAQGFTPGAQEAARHIREKHAKELVLAARAQFPINHPPSEVERAEYF